MNSFKFIDTETTGVNPCEVIEVAWRHYEDIGNFYGIFDNQVEEVARTEERLLFKPTIPITLGARATHHILDSDLEGRPLVGSEDYLAMVKNVQETPYLIGHNIDFDWEALGKPDCKCICTLAIARKILPELDSHSQTALLYYFFDQAYAKQLVRNAHSALVDVLNLELVFNELLKEAVRKGFLHDRLSITIQTIYNFATFCRIPDRATFGEHKGKLWKDIPRQYRQWMITKGSFDEFTKIAVRESLK